MSMFPLASQTLTTQQAGDIFFTNIPQTFRHLQLRMFTRGISSGTLSAWYLVINGDSATNAYTTHSIQGQGGSPSTITNGSTNNTISVDGLPSTSIAANIFSASIIDLYDYTNSNKRKSVRWFNGFNDNTSSQTQGKVIFADSLAVNVTAAVTSLQIGAFNPNGNGWAAGCTFQLYGIGNATATGA